MGNLSRYNVFVDNGELDQKAKNFQNFLFSKIDLRKSKAPISFYRSDFRSAKFSDFVLYKNDFRRADFINAYFENGSITECRYSSDFFNSLFNKINFNDNDFISSTFVNCSFSNSNLTGGVYRDMSIRKCEFNNCVLSGVTFEMNTLDELTFRNCTFLNIDFSNMTAINIFFIDCSFENFSIDPDYLGSYFIVGDFFGKVSFAYRGQKIELFEEQTELMHGLKSLYTNTNRYYELMNILFIEGLYKGSFDKEILNIIPRIFTEENYVIKEYNMVKSLELLKFYLDDPKIDLGIYYLLIPLFEKCTKEDGNKDFQLKSLNKLNYLKVNLENKIFEKTSLLDKMSDKLVLIKMELSINDLEKGSEIVTEYFDECLKENTGDNESYYKIINVRPGSVIVDILCYTFLIVPISLIIKKSIGNVMDTIFDYKFKKKGILLLNKAENTNDVNKIKKIYYDNKNSLGKLSSENQKTKDLSEVLKSLKVFVNTID